MIDVGARPLTRRHRSEFSRARFGMLMTAPYALLLLAFAVFPALYALYLSFVRQGGGFTVFGNFVHVAQDFRYLPSLAHVALFSVVFVIPSMGIAILLGLLLQSRAAATATTFQVLYYIPQGLVGAAGVVLWLFVLTPGVSPIGPLLQGLRFQNIEQVVDGWHLVIVFAIIGVWTSSATSILLIYASLKAIPLEVVEAAYIDGANVLELVIYIKLPLIRKWLAYIFILYFAASLQLFVEPQLVSGVAHVGTDWSPLQLAYDFAYIYVNFPSSAALSFEILAVGVIAAIVIIAKTDLFRVEV